MNPKIGTKFLRGRLHTSEQRLRWLQKSLAKLEQRQQKGFNKNRQLAINRLREQLAMVAVEDGARPTANRQRVNSDRTEDAFSVTSTTEGWPVTKRDAAFAAVNLQPVNTNKTEEKFAVRAVAKGWSVTKRGWPDYLCWRGDEVMCVEVKPEGQDLSTYQVGDAKADRPRIEMLPLVSRQRLCQALRLSGDPNDGHPAGLEPPSRTLVSVGPPTGAVLPALIAPERSWTQT